MDNEFVSKNLNEATSQEAVADLTAIQNAAKGQTSIIDLTDKYVTKLQPKASSSVESGYDYKKIALYIGGVIVLVTASVIVYKKFIKKG